MACDHLMAEGLVRPGPTTIERAVVSARGNAWAETYRRLEPQLLVERRNLFDDLLVTDSYDNAMAESIFGLYETELIRNKGPWRSLDDVELATLEWVDWFNHRRLFYELGRIPPAEFEDQHYRYINSDRQVETQTNTPALAT